MQRAQRAMQQTNGVFYDEGKFWYVRWIHFQYQQVGLAHAPVAPRRSLDDCSPAEWSAASRQQWRDWPGGKRPTLSGTRVEVRLRAGDCMKDWAGNLGWGHEQYGGDIIAWRFAE